MYTFRLKIRSGKNDFQSEKNQEIQEQTMMRKIDCCVCLDNNVCHYTQEDIKTKCEHPVCKNCYFQLQNSECPLCRTDIYSIYIDVKKAIFNILNVRYEKLLGDINYSNLLFDMWGYEFIIILRRRREHPRMKRPRYEIEKYFYLMNRYIEKDIKIDLKVCPQICK